MMAGTGVGGVGGAGMLRTRRRDVSVKPNRKLDRKSSRGMIYENEELRLRTIHINAEVEQGQNDIKKLRRENEQLRREIWSLRDEYDKLEEILKRQQNRSESEEYEDRSEEDDVPQSDLSCDEEYEEDNKRPADDYNQEEQLENAENQKISSEKMSSSLHRLHVEFDHLSVVDEEEELKKDKERKEATPSEEDGQKNGAVRYPPPPVLSPCQLHDNIPFYPATYESASFSGTSYYTECPFEFPSTVDLMLPADTSALLASPCPPLQADPLIPLSGLDASDLNPMADPMLPEIHVPPVGWQSDVLSQKLPAVYAPAMQMMTESSMPSDAFGFPARIKPTTSNTTRFRDVSAVRNDSRLSSSEEAIGGGSKDAHVGPRLEDHVAEETSAAVAERPRHFFAPLACKKKQEDECSPTASTSYFGTGTSSSSGKTASTVISKTNPFAGMQKGSADIYVNGAIPCEDGESRTFLSTDDLLIADGRNASGQLTKSMSCQDLSSESQGPALAQLKHLGHVESQLLTKSDNTLDNIAGGSSGRPYKSHLNVTLRIPHSKERAPSPETPEVPNLPSIEYRLFGNPFLSNFDKTSGYRAPTTPLSIQVNDDGLGYHRVPVGRGVHLGERLRTAADKSRLLLASDQSTNGKRDSVQVTSFERPSPCTLIPSTTPYDLATLRRLNANRYLRSQHPYQNVPFMPRAPGQFYSLQRDGMLYYEGAAKVPAQTQTSIDGDSHHEDEGTISAPNSPSGQRRKKRDKAPVKDQRPLSPAAQRRLRKQSSATSVDAPDSPRKAPRKHPRRLSTTTTSDGQEDKNESRSSSSGQDSPRKDQTRRVSVYVSPKRRSSQTSLKTSRSGSVDASKDKYTDGGGALSSERERTNSISSRETASAKGRKASTSSGNVPWCACWGNGCV